MNSRNDRMAKVFGETSTADEVLSGVNLTGKRVLVTGVSAGLGVETARVVRVPGATRPETGKQQSIYYLNQKAIKEQNGH